MVDKIGRYTHSKYTAAVKALEKDYAGKSKQPLSPSAPVDRAQVRKDRAAAIREPAPAARKHRWS